MRHGTKFISADISTAVNHNKILLASSIYATCFGRVDHTQSLKYMTLKPDIRTTQSQENRGNRKLIFSKEKLYTNKMQI